MITRLPPLLTGKAQRAYLKLTPTESLSYETIKKAILEEYQLSAEHYRNEFRSVKKEKDETFKQFIHRQRLLLNRWLNASNTKRDFESLFELVLTEQFLNILTPNLHFQVALKAPETAAKAAEIAFDYVEIRKEAKDRFKKEKLAEQELQGAMSSEDEKEDTSFDVSKIKCFKCNSFGHKKKNCTAMSRVQVHIPNAETPKNTDTLCDECEKVPFKREYSVKLNGKSCTAIRDTGADEIFVKPKFVNENDYLNKTEKVSLAVLGVNGTFRRANVDIISPFVKGKVQCIVIPDLGPDILIGEKTILENGQELKLPVFPRKRLLKKCVPKIKC